MQDKLNRLLQVRQLSFHPVVNFNPAKNRLKKLDFTDANLDLDEATLNDIDLFTKYIDNQLSSPEVQYGIGGYAEHRTIYSRSSLFDADKPGEEPRRLHLGIDIWGKEGTPVYTPVEGVVHSFAFNNNRGDYGATIIIMHELEGIVFYTLYGHLDLESIGNIEEGDEVKKGNVLAHFGVPAENGYWPPHLHFQIIKDMQGRKGDYPGVCKYSERESYLQNSPDPDLVLQLNRYL